MPRDLFEAISSTGYVLRGLARELVAPSRCASCDGSVRPRTLFCAACASTVERFPPGVRDHDAAFFYGGAMSRAVTRCKYERRSDLAESLGELLAQRATSFAGRIDVVVSVPLHPKRLVERGFDQAALLARPVARSLGVPWRRALVRSRDTPRQASLDRIARASNVVGAFRCTDGGISGARVLLVDDVRTTGATLTACAEALEMSGARGIRTLVLAIRDDACTESG